MTKPEENKTRLQLDFDKEQIERINSLAEETKSATRAEVMRKALMVESTSQVSTMRA